MKKSTNKTLDLIQALKANFEMFAADEPEILSNDFIVKDIEQREQRDAAARYERQKALDEMFPERVNGDLYVAAEQVEYDFWNRNKYDLLASTR